MSFRNGLFFLVLSGFWISLTWAQDSVGMLVTGAKQRYKEAQEENEALIQDTSNAQRQKTIRSIRWALALYSQIIEQYPEMEESLTEDMAVLNSWLFWTRKFAPIDFKEDESETKPEEQLPPKTPKTPEESAETGEDTFPLPLDLQKIEVKKIEAPPEIKKTPLPQDSVRETKYPLETAYHFRQKIAKLLKNRRFFEAIEHSKVARSNTMSTEYQKELDGMIDDLQSILQLYQQWIDALKDTSALTLNFKLITGLKMDGTAKKFDQKLLHIESTQGKFGVNIFMLSTDTLIEMAKLKKLSQLEGLGNLLALWEGNTSKAGEWMKAHSEFKNATTYLKKMDRWKEHEKQVQTLEKERTKQFKNAEKAYDCFNQALEELNRGDENKALYEISKVCPILTLETAREMEELLKKDLKKDWYQVIQDLRYRCTSCKEKRTLICKSCDGRGRTKNPPSFSSRPGSDGQFMCPKCKGKGSASCGDCIWRFNDPKAIEVENFFITQKIISDPALRGGNDNSSSAFYPNMKATIVGEVRWQNAICEEAKVMISYNSEESGNKGKKVFGTDVQMGGYFQFEVIPQQEYTLFYWKDDTMFREDILIHSPFRRMVLTLKKGPLYFVNPEKPNAVLTRPAFLKWSHNNEEHFVVKIFQVEEAKGFSQYKPILISYQVENSLLLPKKETPSGKSYLVLIYGYEGNFLMSQGRTLFKVK